MKACIIIILLLGVSGVLTSANGFASSISNPPSVTGPENELHIARLVFRPNNFSNWHPPGRPWWRIDWPEAEAHLIEGVKRYTFVQTADDSAHVTLQDEAVFDYPLLLAQQVGRWYLDDQEIKRLQTYLNRGGFLIVDDFHGPDQWVAFKRVMDKVLPSHRLAPIKPDNTLMTIHYPLAQLTQIPGRRHIVGYSSDGTAQVQMPHSPQRWLGMFDENNTLQVAINFNMDMGDAWEHANDPYYPNAMTALAYRFGINYILYALTH